jgi:uncharacterized tellurite resistance protein B-like protein
LCKLPPPLFLAINVAQKFQRLESNSLIMENTQTLLEGSNNIEKGAYIGAIASLATADRQASEEEIEYLTALCEAAKLSPDQSQAVIKAATDISADEAQRCLDILKTSELKYSLIADLIAFAKTDSNYSEDEQQNIHRMADYLGVDQKQYSLLDNFAEKATDPATTPEQIASPNFLSSLGLKDKFESAGINGNTLLKGLLGVAAPLILSKMLSGRGRSHRGGFGGLGGGGFGGLGGGLMGAGGLASIISMFSGGRGMGSMGGMLGGLLGGGRRRGGW